MGRCPHFTLPFVGREKILLVVLDVAKILQNLTPRVRLCHQLYQLKEGRRTADDAQRRRLNIVHLEKKCMEKEKRKGGGGSCRAGATNVNVYPC